MIITARRPGPALTKCKPTARVPAGVLGGGGGGGGSAAGNGHKQDTFIGVLSAYPLGLPQFLMSLLSRRTRTPPTALLQPPPFLHSLLRAPPLPSTPSLPPVLKTPFPLQSLLLSLPVPPFPSLSFTLHT